MGTGFYARRQLPARAREAIDIGVAEQSNSGQCTLLEAARCDTPFIAGALQDSSRQDPVATCVQRVHLEAVGRSRKPELAANIRRTLFDGTNR
jgi:hypothetical protein